MVEAEEVLRVVAALQLPEAVPGGAGIGRADLCLVLLAEEALLSCFHARCLTDRPRPIVSRLMASPTVTSPLVLSHHMRVALLAGELVANRLRARSRLRLILPTGHTPLGCTRHCARTRPTEASPRARPPCSSSTSTSDFAPNDERSYQRLPAPRIARAWASAPSTALTAPRRPRRRVRAPPGAARRGTHRPRGARTRPRRARGVRRAGVAARRGRSAGSGSTPPRAPTPPPALAGLSTCRRRRSRSGCDTLLRARELLHARLGRGEGAEALRAMLDDAIRAQTYPRRCFATTRGSRSSATRPRHGS